MDQFVADFGKFNIKDVPNFQSSKSFKNDMNYLMRKADRNESL